MIDASQAGRPRSSETWFVAIAASAGGLQALTELLSALPGDLNAAVAVVQHRVQTNGTQLEWLLSRHAILSVTAAIDGLPIQSGNVYLASSQNHLTVTADRRFSHEDDFRVHGLRSAANPLFESASRAFGTKTIAVVLTGSGSDGSHGIREVSKRGGTVIAQDPATAEYSGMPEAAISTGTVEYVLPLSSIAPAIVAIVSGAAPAEVLVVGFA